LGLQIASSANVLIGDTIYLDSTSGFSEMMPAVHSRPTVMGPSDYSEFYGEKLTDVVETWREPLATAFAFRYANDTAGGISSHVILWKNYAEFNAGYIDDCGSYRLLRVGYGRAFALTPQSRSPVCRPRPRPQSVPLRDPEGPAGQPVLRPAGHLRLDADRPAADPTAPSPTRPSALDPTSNPNYQGWAGLTFEWAGYSAGTDAATMANANCLPDQVLPALGANTGVFPVDWVPAAL
jgi:hypothetical protein